jgi:hypothetical protein
MDLSVRVSARLSTRGGSKAFLAHLRQLIEPTRFPWLTTEFPSNLARP